MTNIYTAADSFGVPYEIFLFNIWSQSIKNSQDPVPICKENTNGFIQKLGVFSIPSNLDCEITAATPFSCYRTTIKCSILIKHILTKHKGMNSIFLYLFS